MTRRLPLLGASVVAALALAGPAAADHNVGPCNAEAGPGHSEYAHHHIVPLAHAGALGSAHKPGSHRGYSFCSPSG